MIPYTPHAYIGIAADGEAKSRTVKFGFLHILIFFCHFFLLSWLDV